MKKFGKYQKYTIWFLLVNFLCIFPAIYYKLFPLDGDWLFGTVMIYPFIITMIYYGIVKYISLVIFGLLIYKSTKEEFNLLFTISSLALLTVILYTHSFTNEIIAGFMSI